MAVVPGRSGAVYVATARGRLYASTDGAATWMPRQGKLPFVSQLVVAPGSPDVLYARNASALFRSTDGGDSWSDPILEGFVGTVCVSPSAPSVLYASKDQSLLRSTDGGARWEATGISGQLVDAVAVDPQDPTRVYALVGDQLMLSTDGGATWASGSGFDSPGRHASLFAAIAIDPRRTATLYASLGPAIFRSTDRGATWSRVWEGPQGGFPSLRTLQVDPSSGAIYATYDNGAGSEIFRSDDGGASWPRIGVLYGVEDLVVDAGTSGRLYAGTRAGGVFRSADASLTWAPSNHGLQDLGFTTVAADPHQPGRLFAVADPDPAAPLGFSPQFLLRSGDGGASWSSPFLGPDASPFVNAVVADPSRPGSWYLAAAGGVLWTGDGGETWENRSRGLRAPEFVASLAVAPSAGDVLYAIGWDSFPFCDSTLCASLRLFRSADGAAQWRRARAADGQPFPRFMRALAVDAASATTVYLAGAGLFKSIDGGVTWARTGRGLRGTVLDLVADPFAPGTLYAAVFAPRGRRVFKSLDAGETWAPASGGLPAGLVVWDLAADPATPHTLYAATPAGVFRTRDGGQLWTAINDGLEGLSISTVAVDPARPGIVLAAGPGGLFELDSSPSPP